mgnify:CR=1 FL=1
MGRLCHIWFTTLVVASLLVSDALASSFTLDDWALSTGIIDTRNHFSTSFTPQPSPYLNEQHITVSPSEAHSYFDFSWTPDTASFFITASHVAFDGNGGTRSLSSGNIYITPAVDLLLTATGTYAYDLPGSTMQVNYSLGAWNTIGSNGFFQTHVDDTILDGPTSGIFALSLQGIIPAGQPTMIRYNFMLDAFSSTGLLATGAGNMQFTLQPVPEPMTITMLALGAVSLSRRVRRHSSSAV